MGSRGNFQRPNVVGVLDGPQTRQEWFNTRALRHRGRLRLATPAGTSSKGPGFANVDFALYKTFSFIEAHRIQLRFEFFNILNRTNYNNPDTSFTNPGFGTITGTGPARQIQFAAKYHF